MPEISPIAPKITNRIFVNMIKDRFARSICRMYVGKSSQEEIECCHAMRRGRIKCVENAMVEAIPSGVIDLKRYQSLNV